MNKELKKAIVNWLFENEKVWQRTNECVKKFRPYIYDENGQHLIGGEEVYEFIKNAEELIYPRDLP